MRLTEFLPHCIIFMSTKIIQKSKVKTMERLKQLRKMRRLTQVDVCRAIDCPRPMYALMESGKISPRDKELVALAQLYNVSVQYLKK